MVDSNYLAHYVNTIRLLAIYLEADVIEQILIDCDGAESPQKAIKSIKKKHEANRIPNGIDNRGLECSRYGSGQTQFDDDELIQIVLYYKFLSDELFGKYGHPHRKFRQPGKGMTEDLCREWYARRIDDILFFGYEKIYRVLVAKEEVAVDVIEHFGFLPLLTPEFQKVFQEDIQKDLVSEIVEYTQVDKTEVEMILYYEKILKQRCGSPRHL